MTTLQPRARAGTFAGLFLTTLATLGYEIALTRIFSVVMWYHFAFVAISVALFGLTVGALIVHLQPERFAPDRLRWQLWLFSLLFSVSIALCFVTQLSIPFVPRLTTAGVWSVLLTCAVISVPFVLSGVVVCLTLTRFPEQVNRLYATDLTGAALGCVALVVLLNVIDGPSAVIGVAAIAGLGTIFFAFDAASPRGVALAAVAALVLGGFAALNATMGSHGQAPLRILWAKERMEGSYSYDQWNAFSRVTVDKGRPSDSVKNMVIDGTAGTALTRFNGDLRTTDYLRDRVTYLVDHARRNADVLVIGSGGGSDVLASLEFGQRSVTGVEVNGNVLKGANGAFGDFTGHLDRQPGVRFVNEEARSYLARTPRKYDVIQISLIDTWAATSAGAFALSENSLYTTEAWQLYLHRLKPGGILSVSRFYELPGTTKPLEMYRTTALASQALKDYGIANPRDHLLIYRGKPDAYGATLATLMVSPQPFSAADRARVGQEAARQGFAPVLTPDQAIDRHFLALADKAGPSKAVRDFSQDISAPTDERPFFFQMASLKTLFQGNGFADSYTVRPVLVLGLLALTVLLLAGGCVALPMLVTTRRSDHRGMRPFYIYFGAIGFGFLVVEIGMLQRLSAYLGQPTYALSVVLFSVLLFSGAGSMITERIVRPHRRASLVAPVAVLVALVVAYRFLAPAVIHATRGATTPVRILTAVGLLVPLGLAMGMPFVIGMRAAVARASAPTAFLWGINGTTSVCASVFGTVIALFFGISKTFWAGALAYGVAATAMVVITQRTAHRTDDHPSASSDDLGDADPVEEPVEVVPLPV